MLETSTERVKLLRDGITGKTIEKLYIAQNKFKIISYPVLIKVDEVSSNRRSLE